MKRRWAIGGGSVLLIIAALAVPHWLLVGTTEGQEFDGPRYGLPWTPGDTHRLVQGNQSRATHRGRHAGAWDFWMPIGTTVDAARDGVVETVEAGHGNWPGPHPANHITIRHEDCTLATYAHLRGDGMSVAEGDRVRRGDPIGTSGMSGHTMYPHLHFYVVDADEQPVPSSFDDIPGDGVPRMWRKYEALEMEAQPQPATGACPTTRPPRLGG